jgi:Ca-activated chloride channel family protein
MYRFEEDIWFACFVIIPVILLLFFVQQLWMQKTQKDYADSKLLALLSPERSLFKSALKTLLRCMAISALIIALVNPKIGSKLETVKREGVDVVFAVDVSKSMLAEDIAPNRLEKSKQLVSQIINNLASDRVGIIAYAGKAFPQLPITTDYAASKMFLQNLNTSMLSSQGTAIEDAVSLARTYFDDEEQTNRVLFILSDGEDHNDLDFGVAEQAAIEGIRIFSIGVGTEKGGPIPIRKNGVVMSWKKNQENETVITKLNTTTLRSLADTGGGEYLNGSNTEEVVKRVGTILANMDKKEFEAKTFSEYKDQFQWFIGLGILFLFLDLLCLNRKTYWLKRLNLFNENL